ncbi:MAG: hypothetical protein AB7J13_16550 [Pyrinomonadaceae bacterium]
MRSLKHLFAVSTIILAVAAASAFACGCGGVPGQTVESIVGGAVNASTVVFQGKVIGFEYRKGITNDFMLDYRDERGKPIEYETMVVRFAVDLWWKGDLVREILLTTGVTRNADGTASTNSCEVHFKNGVTYLVFAGLDKAAAMPRTDSCSLTREANDDVGVAAGIRRVLGEGIVPSRPKM